MNSLFKDVLFYRNSVGLLLMVGVLIVLYACAPGTQRAEPVLEANGVELQVEALYGDWTNAEKRYVAVLNNPNIAESIKDDFKVVYDKVNPRVEQLEAKKEKIAALKISKPEDVPGAIAALDALLRDVYPDATGFIGKVQSQGETQ